MAKSTMASRITATIQLLLIVIKESCTVGEDGSPVQKRPNRRSRPSHGNFPHLLKLQRWCVVSLYTGVSAVSNVPEIAKRYWQFHKCAHVFRSRSRDGANHLSGIAVIRPSEL